MGLGKDGTEARVHSKGGEGVDERCNEGGGGEGGGIGKDATDGGGQEQLEGSEGGLIGKEYPGVDAENGGDGTDGRRVGRGGEGGGIG